MSEDSTLRSLLDGLALVPAGVRAAILIRHAHRGPIAPGTFGDDAPLTDRGVKAAERLGAALGPVVIGRVMSSPMARCVATGSAILQGSGAVGEIPIHQALGVPGAFVENSTLAGPQFLELGPMEVMSRHLRGLKVPGMREPSEAASMLLSLVPDDRADDEGLDLLITHDSVIAGFIGHLLKIGPNDESWPAMLEGPIIWLAPGGGVRVVWRARLYEIGN